MVIKERKKGDEELWGVRFFTSQEHLFIGKMQKGGGQRKEWVKEPQNIRLD